METEHKLIFIYGVYFAGIYNNLQEVPLNKCEKLTILDGNVRLNHYKPNLETNNYDWVNSTQIGEVIDYVEIYNKFTSYEIGLMIDIIDNWQEYCKAVINALRCRMELAYIVNTYNLLADFVEWLKPVLIELNENSKLDYMVSQRAYSD